ncbi:sirohydrochlorin cobaltochelatase [Desulfonema ishimotonii]|uniref:Sirohydrochlorin cobaltochelatase n=1 Tax=Desulfonema ishimotonii TaxID=45657 RepID=A0A401FVP9_9BACT|nr:sirohydrochlorin cobaltochelatase [Desulfonema ishimotonii]GBC61035.1 sirohydrochlorin cobaltochelatase [Desulfonema ishimotonii]
MKTPIVLAAFGTTTRAMDTYSFIDRICAERFPEHPIYWAFSSRIVKERSSGRKNDIRMQHPCQVLSELKQEGYDWAVVQSLHLMCGHEFFRLLEEVRECDIRTSMGLPLLNQPEDYYEIADIFIREFSTDDDEALVLVGHGTDHPGWCSYVALDHICRRKAPAGLYVGVVEHGHPTMDSVIRELKRAGYKRARLVPFLLVAGMHFAKDMSGAGDSWKRAFEAAGISVSLEDRGIGFNRSVIRLFCQHIEDALEVIP